MVFTKEKSYKTKLEIQEIIDSLNLITEKYYTNSSEKFKFEGKIKNDGFVLLPTFDYNSNSQLRPEVIGKLKKVDEITEVDLKFQLPDTLKILLVFALTLNLGILFLMILFPELTTFPLWDKWWSYLIFIIITFFLFNSVFTLKVNKTETILKQLLDI
ncbi:hypothetical protein [Aquimarina longa]|uniref:hypothetical protein n=1 Tax=Aquimarina longa TaxID=1080221 RepID=UPI0007807BC7|nr:hypothetical protein [Aquimarina longa]